MKIEWNYKEMNFICYARIYYTYIFIIAFEKYLTGF